MSDDARSDSDAYAARVIEFSALMCACTDRACAARVKEDFEQVVRTTLEEGSTADEIQAFRDATRKYTECYSYPGDDPGGARHRALRMLESYKDRVCDCDDRECGDAVMKQLLSWSEMFDAEYGYRKPNAEQVERAESDR